MAGTASSARCKVVRQRRRVRHPPQRRLQRHGQASRRQATKWMGHEGFFHGNCANLAFRFFCCGVGVGVGVGVGFVVVVVVVVVVLRVVMLCVRVFLDGNQSNCGYLKFQGICCFSPNEVYGYF